MKATDRVGERFQHLEITSVFVKMVRGKKLSHANCKCDCGNEKVVTICNLVQGNTRSCGCLKRNITSRFYGRRLSR